MSKAYFNDLEINRFRGFDRLEVKDLSCVNVFVGANNVGKTSILESVFLLSGLSNPLLAARVNHRRSFVGNDLDSVRYLFHNVDLSRPPLLQAHTADGFRSLVLNPLLSVEADAHSGNGYHASVKGIDLDFSTQADAAEMYHARVFREADGSLGQQTDSRYTETLKSVFVSVENQDRLALDNYVNLIKRGRKEQVLQAIRAFDPAICSLEALPDGLYLGLEGVEELLPVGMAGDGVRRMLNIVSTILTEDYQIVMIDEFDAGLHYTAHKSLWQAVLQFVREHGLQLFVTTHNLESLQSLEQVLEADEACRGLVAVYNVAKTAQRGFQTYRYAYGDLKEAVNNEIEIRR